jgi:hypothetical protein
MRWKNRELKKERWFGDFCSVASKERGTEVIFRAIIESGPFGGQRFFFAQ